MNEKALLYVVGVLGSAGILQGAETAGQWRLGFLSIPNTLGIQENGAGAVTALDNQAHFSNGQGHLDLAADGSFTGALESPISGTIQISPAGVGISSLGNVFYFNDNADFAAGVYSDGPGWLDLECMVRPPAVTPELSVLEGRWNLVSIDAPTELTTLTNGMGAVTDVMPLNHFGVFTGHAVFDDLGSFSGSFDGPFSGTVSLGAQGAVTSPDFAPGEVFRLNASSDVMFSFHSEEDYRFFTGMVKAPASLMTHELQGRWHLVSINTPDSLMLEKNVDNEVIGINGENHFEIFSGHLDMTAAGAVSGQFDGPVTGTASAGSNGMVSLQLDDNSLTAYINASKDVMMIVQTEPGPFGQSGYCELIILVRSIVPRVITIDHGNEAVHFKWPDDGQVRLQRSINLMTWDDVVTPGGSYSETLSNISAYFRLAMPPPPGPAP